MAGHFPSYSSQTPRDGSHRPSLGCMLVHDPRNPGPRVKEYVNWLCLGHLLNPWHKNVRSGSSKVCGLNVERVVLQKQAKGVLPEDGG